MDTIWDYLAMKIGALWKPMVIAAGRLKEVEIDALRGNTMI